ncbi:hypothetical protein AB0M92_18870 [Streptomyces sp. NPDC051582]|uniref:hypothetical protein n=1 Tax=Streptomyces sp. NPDC051582 TaxID=3155167 RepID=UPI00342355FB
MLTLLLIAGGLTLGYLTGRARPAHRASDWAHWQQYGQRPTGIRYAAVWTIRSAENIGWLMTHPVKGWHAWRTRNDPPPPRSPAIRLAGDWPPEDPR